MTSLPSLTPLSPDDLPQVNVKTVSWGTPLLAACKNRQGEEMLRLLVLHGRASRRPASLGLSELEAADEMCSAVAEGDR